MEFQLYWMLDAMTKKKKQNARFVWSVGLLQEKPTDHRV